MSSDVTVTTVVQPYPWDPAITGPDTTVTYVRSLPSPTAGGIREFDGFVFLLLIIGVSVLLASYLQNRITDGYAQVEYPPPPVSVEPMDSRMKLPVNFLAVFEPKRCAYCFAPLQGSAFVTCPLCKSAVHTDCYSENRACPVFGCQVRTA